MPTRNVNLTEELDRAVQERVRSGRYENASEVVRAALRALEQREQEDAAKLKRLRRALDEGLSSGVYPGDPFDDVRKELGWPSKRKRAGKRG